MKWIHIARVSLASLGFVVSVMLMCACATSRSGPEDQARSIPNHSDELDSERSPEPTEAVSRKQVVQQTALPVGIPPGQITGVEMGQVFSMIHENRVLLIDCRPPIYYHLGHLDGAISLPLKSYDKVIESRKTNIVQALADKKVIVLYCQNVKCPDAYAVAKKLGQLGYPVSVYKGGWEEWKQAGL